jgi:hypothetical protein
VRPTIFELGTSRVYAGRQSIRRAIYGHGMAYSVRLIIFACTAGSDVRQSPYSCLCAYLLFSNISGETSTGERTHIYKAFFCSLQNYLCAACGVQLCQAGAEFSLHSFDMNQMMPAATSLITSHPVCVSLCVRLGLCLLGSRRTQN